MTKKIAAMKLTETMKERETRLNSQWRDEGGGYASLIGRSSAFDNPMLTAFIGGSGELAYVAVPEGHPDVGKDSDDLDPDVNGGLTFAEDNVFGWDYGHAYNFGSPETDIPEALRYFRERIEAERA